MKIQISTHVKTLLSTIALASDYHKRIKCLPVCFSQF